MFLFIYYKSALLLIFFAHALVIAGMLTFYAYRHQNRSAKWLSLLILLAGLYVVPWMLGHDGWYGRDGYRDFLFFVPFQQFYLIAPVLYLYIRSVIDPSRQLVKKDYVLFIPAALYLLYSLVVFITDFLILEDYYFYADRKDKDLDPWYQVTGLSMMLAFIYKSYRQYQSYRSEIFDLYSYADSIRFSWIKQFLICLSIIVILRVIFFLLYPNWGDFGDKWWYYFFFSCMFYFVGMSGLLHVVRWHTLSSNLIISSMEKDTVDRLSETVDSEELDSLKSKIEEFLSGGGYKNPGLSLIDVATSLDTTTKKVSQVINQRFEMNFNDLVNKKRVDRVVELIQKEKHLKYNLLGLAMQCGFNSKTTFNRSFKKVMGMTPIEYVKTYQKSAKS